MKKNIESQIWLDKALDDLLWTKHNLEGKIYYGACFTAQQSAEKALKAYLIHQQGRFAKTHDLVDLINNCSKFNKDFSALKENAAKLSYYYTKTRYPDIFELDIYNRKEAFSAFDDAEKIVFLVRKKIS